MSCILQPANISLERIKEAWRKTNLVSIPAPGLEAVMQKTSNRNGILSRIVIGIKRLDENSH